MQLIPDSAFPRSFRRPVDAIDNSDQHSPFYGGLHSLRPFDIIEFECANCCLDFPVSELNDDMLCPTCAFSQAWRLKQLHTEDFLVGICQLCRRLDTNVCASSDLCDGCYRLLTDWNLQFPPAKPHDRREDRFARRENQLHYRALRKQARLQREADRAAAHKAPAS